MEKNELPDNSLDTEGGMFEMEISNSANEAKELIEASEVNQEIKQKCIIILEELLSDSANQKNKVDPDTLSRNAVSKLLGTLDQNDEEQTGLFEAVKGVIWKACYSVKGWKWPPEKI